MTSRHAIAIYPLLDISLMIFFLAKKVARSFIMHIFLIIIATSIQYQIKDCS